MSPQVREKAEHRRCLLWFCYQYVFMVQSEKLVVPTSYDEI